MCAICYKTYINAMSVLCCHNVKKLPYMPNLQYLDFSNNKHIKEIPYLPKLILLRCENTNIKKIPELPNLTWLYCDKTNIKKIPHLPNLITITCNYTNIKIINNLPKLSLLECCGSKIQNINNLPNLTELYCSFCLYLHTIELFPKLIKLYCLGSRIVTLELPKDNIVDVISLHSIWLEQYPDDIKQVIKIQQYFRRHIKKRILLTHKYVYTHRDLLYIFLNT